MSMVRLISAVVVSPTAGVTSCGPCSPPAMQAGDSSACTANSPAPTSPPPRPASWPASPGTWPPACARPCSSGRPDSTAEPGPGVIEVTDQVELITFNQAAVHWLTDAGGA